jgi:VanZ family protein
MQAGDRARAADDPDLAAPPRRAPVWAALLWLLAIVALSATATLRPQLLLQWTRYLPGRDKTGHFLLMGGFAGVSLLAFAGRRIGSRRVSRLAVLAVVALLVVAEEFVQRWLPNRTFSGTDLASSLAGVVCFGAITTAVRAVRRTRSSRDPR